MVINTLPTCMCKTLQMGLKVIPPLSLSLCVQTALQVPAPVSGVLEELLVADGDTVTAGMDIARIRVSTGANIIINIQM